ncbi:MAG TPA: hypothetical protein PLL20_21175 [Phycisphaerae bacterium]|nr:hypothetical protein [Phycisphaerae bacterium]HRR87160.1 hypothetical protein [Phycisphaerae bacterium]
MNNADDIHAGAMCCLSLVALVSPFMLLFVRTSSLVKWLSLAALLCSFAAAMAWALPRDADIPPLHMAFLFVLSGVAMVRHWFHASPPRTTGSEPQASADQHSDIRSKGD